MIRADCFVHMQYIYICKSKQLTRILLVFSIGLGFLEGPNLLWSVALACSLSIFFNLPLTSMKVSDQIAAPF